MLRTALQASVMLSLTVDLNHCLVTTYHSQVNFIHLGHWRMQVNVSWMVQHIWKILSN